jgi:hypothetical protein
MEEVVFDRGSELEPAVEIMPAASQNHLIPPMTVAVNHAARRGHAFSAVVKAISGLKGIKA